jgi:hypothetical protein
VAKKGKKIGYLKEWAQIGSQLISQFPFQATF